MTNTRKYYNKFIELFASLCNVKPDEISSFLQIKDEIANLISRIQKFNLFPLSFSEEFFSILYERKLKDFTTEKLTLVSELNFELNQCLYTTRIRYGGELLYYLLEIKYHLLNMSLIELEMFLKFEKKASYYLNSEDFIFNNEQDKEIARKKLKSDQKKNLIKKKKIIIKKADYNSIEKRLNYFYSLYKDYILNNYPEIKDIFSFYNKKNIIYITEGGNDFFELRIHAYKTEPKICSLCLKHEYYDFYPSYSSNLEEISDELIFTRAQGLTKSNLYFENPFTIENIHREAINYYIKNSNQIGILQLTEFLLKLEEYHILSDVKKNGINANKDGINYNMQLIQQEVRFPEQLLNDINSFKKEKPESKQCLVFVTSPGKYAIELLQENGVKCIALYDLITKHFSLNNSKIIHWFVKFNLIHLAEVPEKEMSSKGMELIDKLKKCQEGEKGWPEYELTGIEIFKFLFEDSFKSYIADVQSENDLRNHRRDLLVSNYFKDPTSFWAEVKTEYKAKAIIIDFKNYSEKLDANTFFNVSKYTTKKVGNFAIVFSRKGLDQSAIKQQRQLLADGKLVIEFCDEELIEMINDKMLGIDPIYRLKLKEFDLVKS